MLAFGISSGSCLSAASTFYSAPIKCPQHFVHEESMHYRSQARRLVVHCGRRGGGRDNKRRGDGRRPHRVGELIRREISSIIDDAFARTFVNPESSSRVLVSVVDVRCSDDLRNARVSVSVLGTDEEKNDALRWLREARKEIRFELAQSVQLKYVPELSFSESEVAQAVKTVNILNMLAKEREAKQSINAGQNSRGDESSGSSSTLVSGQDLDLDASAEDGIILDDLEDFDEFFDEDSDAEDALIIDVTEEDEDFESLSDADVKKMLFKTISEDDVAR